MCRELNSVPLAAFKSEKNIDDAKLAAFLLKELSNC